MKNKDFIPREAVEAAWMPSYAALNYQCGQAAAVLQRSQTIIERQFSAADKFPRVLEIGSGSGAHFDSIRHGFDHYIASDISDFFLDTLRKKFSGRSDVSVAKIDAYALPFPDAYFDRIIATHVLEHLTHPVKVLEEWDRCLSPTGVISIILPCDPGLLYRIGRSFGPRRRAQRAGLPYDYVMAREHVNSVYSLITLIRFHFPAVQEYWWPFPLLRLPDLQIVYGAHLRK